MMKKILAILLCVMVVFPCCLPFAAAKKETETQTTEFKFTLDVNERYTDIKELDEDDIHNAVGKTEDEQKKESKRIIYISVLVAALVVSVVVLVVTLKRVPDEDEVDISGTGKKKVENKKE